MFVERGCESNDTSLSLSQLQMTNKKKKRNKRRIKKKKKKARLQSIFQSKLGREEMKSNKRKIVWKEITNSSKLMRNY